MKIWELDSPTIGDIVEFITQDTVVLACVVEANDSKLVLQMLGEASGYIPKTKEEARDPRWSAALTADVGLNTMRDQLRAFFPTVAPVDGQQQILEATYHGKEVTLGKPYHYKGSKKFYIYIKDPDTKKIIKVRFGKAHPKRVKTRSKHKGK